MSHRFFLVPLTGALLVCGFAVDCRGGEPEKVQLQINRRRASRAAEPRVNPDEQDQSHLVAARLPTR